MDQDRKSIGNGNTEAAMSLAPQHALSLCGIVVDTDDGPKRLMFVSEGKPLVQRTLNEVKRLFKLTTNESLALLGEAAGCARKELAEHSPPSEEKEWHGYARSMHKKMKARDGMQACSIACLGRISREEVILALKQYDPSEKKPKELKGEQVTLGSERR